MHPDRLLILGLLALRLPADEPAAPVAAPARPAVQFPAAVVTPPAAGPKGPETITPAAAEVGPAATSPVADRELPPPEHVGGSGASRTDLQFSESLPGGMAAELPAPRLSTNVVRIQGIGPRAVKPARFGGFFQLFNPFAPATEPMEAQSVFWYDGQLNTAPRPRALRDEKTETPVGGVVVTVGR